MKLLGCNKGNICRFCIRILRKKGIQYILVTGYQKVDRENQDIDNKFINSGTRFKLNLKF